MKHYPLSDGRSDFLIDTSQSAMDTLPSGGFKPVQPDGFVISPGSREAPKIEITGTDPLCHPPLSLSSCDVALCDRDDFHHHGDGGGVADHLADDDLFSSRQRAPCSSRRGPRRSDGGPGKCPSPSRNSPRRHSPVPYSPKRQHHSRTSTSSVTSDEFPDVTLSPRRHSPVPVLPQERPCSLPLTPSEEFICVSYSDPFSSPTITHTSDAFLAISINCGQSVQPEGDVEMTAGDPQGEVTSGDHQLGTTSDDHNTVSEDVGSECTDSRQTWSDSKCSDDRTHLLQDNLVGCNCNGRAPGPSKVFESLSVDVDQNDVSFKNEFQEGGGDTLGLGAEPIYTRDGTVCGESDALHCGQQVTPKGEPCSIGHTASDCALESMEGEDYFHQAAYSSDSSSEDDDMEEMLLAAQPSSISCYTPSLLAQKKIAENAIIPKKCSQGFARDSEEVLAAGGDLRETDPPKDVSDDQEGTDEAQSLSVFTNSNAAWRRASFPFQHQGWGSLPPCPQWEGGRRRTTTEGSRTPEDFSLPRVVGHPPLHYPHGQGAVLVHCALPSPYDPHMPTPPIVLTPHTSYSDLNVAVDGQRRPGFGAESSVFASYEGEPRSGVRRPDIARSRSFPNLDQQLESRFQEPHQAWPVLGALPSAQPGSDDHMVDGEHHHRGMEADSGSEKKQYLQGEADIMGQLNKATTSQSLPDSPTNNGRAAVIGRLRRVVERRLSGTLEDGP